MENKDIKVILNYIRLLQNQIFSTSDNELLIELLNHIDDVCKVQLLVIEDLEEE